MHRC